MTTAATRVHAFGDDALGDHDAVGLAGEIRAGPGLAARGGRGGDRPHPKVDAAAQRAGLRPVRRGRRPSRGPRTTGSSRGCPRFVKDNSDVAGLPTQQGTRAYVAEPAAADGDFARMLGLVGATDARQDPALGVRLQPERRVHARRPRAQPLAHRPHLRRLVSRLGGARRCRRRADGPRQRRRRLDPDPGRVLRTGRPQGDPRPDPERQAQPRDARADRARRRGHPVRA